MKDQELSKQYIEGFNKGYLIREHKPELALNLSQTKFPDTERDFGSGLKDGIQQKELELTKEKGRDLPNKNIELDRER